MLQGIGSPIWSRGAKVWADIGTPAASLGFIPRQGCEQELHRMMVTMATSTLSIQASICLAPSTAKIDCCFWKLLIIYPCWLDNDDILLSDQFCPAFFQAMKTILIAKSCWQRGCCFLSIAVLFLLNKGYSDNGEVPVCPQHTETPTIFSGNLTLQVYFGDCVLQPACCGSFDTFREQGLEAGNAETAVSSCLLMTL